MNLADNPDLIPEPPHIEKGTYRHYKGNIYEVIGIAFHSETLEAMVVYRAHEQKRGAEYWVRPYKMFFDELEVDGKRIPRFEKISE